jgi:APA family basic amino acid/polyamine antiporter
LPIFKNIKRDWEADQKAVLLSAEEYELLEHYKLALAERDKLLKKQAGHDAKENGRKV